MTITHNHPLSSGLSASDILKAMEHNAQELRAVCKDGSVFAIKRGAIGYPKGKDYYNMLSSIEGTLKGEFPKIHPTKFINTLEVQKRKADLLIKKLADRVEYIKYQ